MTNNRINHITLTQMQYVIAVAETANYSAAARMCGVSQPTLSLAVAKFERFIGIDIFERFRCGSKNGARVTETGKQVVEKCKLVLAGVDKIFLLAGKDTPPDYWYRRYPESGKGGIPQRPFIGDK